jgi:hypothetical protein
MRAQKVIPLGGSRSVTLNEMRVRDARKIMAQAKELDQVDIKSVLTERFDEVAALLGDCIVMPAGETLDDLSFSEVAPIIDGLMEVNVAFLDLLGMADLAGAAAQKILSATSTEPASSSLNEDMQE